jgi:hypothetical protein
MLVDRYSAGLFDNLQALDHPASPGDDVFHDQHRFAGFEIEAPAKDQNIVLFFGENVTGARLPRELLANDQAAHGRRQHGAKNGQFGLADFAEQKLAQFLDGAQILANLRALKVMSAVQSRPKDEMPLQQRPRARENLQHLLLNRVHRARLIRVNSELKT